MSLVAIIVCLVLMLGSSPNALIPAFAGTDQLDSRLSARGGPASGGRGNDKREQA